MNWDQLLNAERPLSTQNRGDVRSQFQRDFDRLIFSGPFRRLQNKTQVFPLPGSIFVHNRLTHSLEVASVGRSLGHTASKLILGNDGPASALLAEAGEVVAAACLAHDLGNPPFGHSGEEAISSFFAGGDGKHFRTMVDEWEWNDLLAFEGNANALRLLTNRFNGRREGGFNLTYATLSTLVKYPWPSIANPGKAKYGFFKSEQATWQHIARKCGLPMIDPDKNKFARHPLVYLVEAADDISYLIMDVEDAHKLRILGTDETENILFSFLHPENDRQLLAYLHNIYAEVTDINERIAYLRATVINNLVKRTAAIFAQHAAVLLEGKPIPPLVQLLDPHYKKAFDNCRKLSVQKIYRHPSVVKIELTGFNVLGTLLAEFAEATLAPDRPYNKKLLSLIPQQYAVETDSPYQKLRSVIDFLSGMTDLYAMQLYRDLKGISTFDS
ncbi:MAG TPA: dNTP triphosphohydrolase [Bacteroidales bacterium]|nr:dNTP triphosphohydrolase [Bacteroidales bacterium]